MLFEFSWCTGQPHGGSAAGLWKGSFREREKKLKVPGKTYLGSGQHPKVTDGKKEEKLHLLHSGLTKAGGPHRTSWQI